MINDKNNIILSIDDGMMGVSLLTRLKSMCSSGQTSAAIWLQRVWGSVIDIDLPNIENKNKTAKKWPFTVHKLLKKQEIKTGTDKSIRIFVESY